MDQPQLIVGMKIVVVSATHAFKTLLLSLMEKKKGKKRKGFLFRSWRSLLFSSSYFPLSFSFLFFLFREPLLFRV